MSYCTLDQIFDITCQCFQITSQPSSQMYSHFNSSPQCPKKNQLHFTGLVWTDLVGTYPIDLSVRLQVRQKYISMGSLNEKCVLGCGGCS